MKKLCLCILTFENRYFQIKSEGGHFHEYYILQGEYRLYKDEGKEMKQIVAYMIIFFKFNATSKPAHSLKYFRCKSFKFKQLNTL